MVKDRVATIAATHLAAISFTGCGNDNKFFMIFFKITIASQSLDHTTTLCLLDSVTESANRH